METDEKSLFATGPVGVTSFPLFGREEAFFKAFQFIFEGWFARKNKTSTDRTQNPLIFFPASPGLGKTRMLNALTRLPRRPTDDSRLGQFRHGCSNILSKFDDEELKWSVIEAIRRNHNNIRDSWVNCSPEDINEFCDLMLTKTCGIVITFNNRTNLTSKEIKKEMSISEMLGVRIAFEAHLVEGYDYNEFGIFLESLMKDHKPTFDWALDCLFQKAGPKKHVILGVDEVLLGAGVANYDQYIKSDANVLREMLSLVGTQMDKRKHLHVVLTSLSYIYFAEQTITSGRRVCAINLRNLSFDEAMALAMWYHDDIRLPPEQQWIEDKIARQIVEDCDGAPRLLENVFKYLKPRKSLQELRGLCMQIDPISKLNAKRDRLMIVVLVLALRGFGFRPDTDEAKCFDEAVYRGYLPSSSVYAEDEDTMEPIFPLMTMLCLCEKSKLTRGDLVFDLWECIQRVLRFDSDTMGNHFSGLSFEAFFRELWCLRLLCRRFQIYQDQRNGATARKNKSSCATLSEMLTSFGKSPDISKPGDDSTSAFDVSLDMESCRMQSFAVNGVTEKEIYNNDLHQILTPKNPIEPGLGDIFTFPLPHQRNRVRQKSHKLGKKVAVFAFQYKFSKPDSSISIGNATIADAFLKTFRENFKVFERAVEQNVFGFVFVSGSTCNGNVRTEAVRNIIGHKLEELQETPAVKQSILDASWHIAIMKRDDVLKFIPRSFRSRPQFRLERDFGL